ncbi:MAG: hypothetical protein AB1648_06840, partial [Pseudomonadota bacterium]
MRQSIPASHFSGSGLGEGNAPAADATEARLKEALNKSEFLAVAATQPVWEATAGRFGRVANPHTRFCFPSPP